MSMSSEDYARESAISDLHGEAIIKEATRQQCIYLFVEGESEEISFETLLDIEFNEIGVRIANYNGIGNLKHSLRLINKTLSNDRPIIVTYDNDEEGQRIVNRICDEDYHKELITFFKIPQESKVKFPKGHNGGSFEEIFDYEYYLDCCFSANIMEDRLLKQKESFLKIFDKSKPWFQQVKRFCANNQDYKFDEKKIEVAENLAINCKEKPKTIELLTNLIFDVRKENPVKHPDDVDLPKIPGLTC